MTSKSSIPRWTREATQAQRRGACRVSTQPLYDHLVAIDERELAALEIWPSTDELSKRIETGGLVLLPDDVSEAEGEIVASFREAAQALRVGANRAGVPVVFAAPPGARLGVYRERAADWVLPYVLSIPTGVVIGLIVNEIQRVLNAARRSGQAVPTFRFREVVVEGRRMVVRELTGPADELIRTLRERLPRDADGDD
jgi:hypothetical protein